MLKINPTFHRGWDKLSGMSIPLRPFPNFTRFQHLYDRLVESTLIILLECFTHGMKTDMREYLKTY